MKADTPGLIFKIVARPAWRDACRAGVYAGSTDDVRDGFIHFSTVHQVANTATKHFKGIDDLVLVAYEASRLGAALIWEPSRGGQLFPHFYGALPTRLAAWEKPLALGQDGVPVMPEDVAT